MDLGGQNWAVKDYYYDEFSFSLFFEWETNTNIVFIHQATNCIKLYVSKHFMEKISI